MRIVIDLQGAQSASKFRGIGRYSLSLALAMARNACEHEIWLVLNAAFPESILNIRHAFEGLIPSERIRVFDVPESVAEVESTNGWRIRTAEKIREHFIQQLKPDIVHVSSLFEGYVDDAVTSVGAFNSELFTAVTLYDLIPLLNPKDYLTNEVHRAYYLRKIQSLKNSDFLLAISEASRFEAVEILQFPSNNVFNISAAADEKFKPITLTIERIKQLKSYFGIQRNIVLYAPGGFDQRKNFEVLIAAYSMLSSTLRASHQLVLVGSINANRLVYLQELAKQAGLDKNELVITGYISDDELVELYNMATLFVFPSKQEGFGLPVLEAMACGTPVIGSNINSIREVINFPEALFDPFSAKDFCERITEVLFDKPFRDRLSIHGLKQAENFSWDASAKQALSTFEIMVKERMDITSKVMLYPTHELIQSIAEIPAAYKPKDTDLLRVAECIDFNCKLLSRQQLLLDISEIVQRDAKSGIQRVVRSLLIELIENPPENTDVCPIYFDGIHYKYANVFTAAFTGRPSKNAADEIVGFYQDDIYLALDLNAGITDIVHDFHLRLQCRGIKLYFIVYDILLVQHPEWWPDGVSVMFETWLNSISEVATGLVCISEAVAEDVRTWIKKNPPRRLSDPVICSFHLGADVQNSMPSKGLPIDAQAIFASLGARPSFLMVGTLEPRKGHTQTLSAFELLWGQGVDVNLVIVGKQGWLVDPLIDKLRRHSELKQHLFWLEGVSDEFLEKIYVASTCLIAASEGEGFGLPLIEAAQHNKPIIARDIPVFREVAGENALFFSGSAPKDLANTVNNWLALNQRDEHPRSEKLQYLSWQESALQLKKQLHLYESP